MHKVELCDKCKATNIDSLVPKIKKISNDIDIKIHCIQYCGVGRDKIVILVDNKPIIGNNEEDVINKLRDKLNS